MAKIGGNALLAGAAFCYISCVIAFQASLSATVGDASVVVVSTIVLASALPTAAYSVGLMIARGGILNKVLLFGSLHGFHTIALLGFCSSGFWASLSYSMLAAGVAFLAKLADNMDDQYNIGKSVAGNLGGAIVTTIGSGSESAMCFFMVCVLSFTLLAFDLMAPTPGSLHQLVAGLYSTAAQQPLHAEEKAEKIVIATVKLAEDSTRKSAKSLG